VPTRTPPSSPTRWPSPGCRPAHPDLNVAEAGDASTDAAGNALLASDFHTAELMPVTLILLLVVFGALITAAF